jgi:hypothetical protein
MRPAPDVAIELRMQISFLAGMIVPGLRRDREREVCESGQERKNRLNECRSGYRSHIQISDVIWRVAPLSPGMSFSAAKIFYLSY